MTKLESRLHIENCIAQLRNAQNMTQQDLAEAIQVTRGTIIALEKGSYNPSLELAFRLAAFFKRPVDAIFFERGNNE